MCVRISQPHTVRGVKDKLTQPQPPSNWRPAPTSAAPAHDKLITRTAASAAMKKTTFDFMTGMLSFLWIGFKLQVQLL